ncbi:LicD family protein [Ideonella livida]|uniref:Uncharacterized protein n=1 Tax=Ideonella livida TaxID=2707176 RepID=A0A7C9TJC7_9BURK|nr:LicD family protein [Ideonella livida]NDY90964.1 hypothetical protein [Ideonella livida]
MASQKIKEDLLPVYFGCGDGSELSLNFHETEACALRLSHPRSEPLRIEGIDVQIGKVWRPLDATLVRTLKCSTGFGRHSQHEACGFPVTTRAGRRIELRVEFKASLPITGVRVHNRPDANWQGMSRLEVALEAQDGRHVMRLDLDTASGTRHYFERLFTRTRVDCPDAGTRQALGQLGEAFLAGEDARALNSFEALFERLLTQGFGFVVRPASGAPSLRKLSRLLLTLALQLRARGQASPCMLFAELLITTLGQDARLAFNKLKLGPAALIDNALYDYFNRRLQEPQVVACLGEAYAFLSHGLLPLRKKADPQAAVQLARTLADRLVAEGFERTYLAYGALLGAVRHGHLLDHDDDVDLLVLLPSPDSYTKALPRIEKVARAAGLSLERKRTRTPPYALLQCKSADTLTVDIFIGWKVGEGADALARLPMGNVAYGEMPWSLVEDHRPLNLLGHDFRVPKQAEGFLQARYGAGWQVPDLLYRLREGVRPGLDPADTVEDTAPSRPEAETAPA